MATSASATAILNVLRPGDEAKPDPFIIVIVANPALESPWNSGTFIADPITGNQSAFDGCVRYIEAALFGNLPSQREKLLADPAIEPHVRLISLFVTGLPPVDRNALAAEDGVSNLLVARQSAFVPFLKQHNLSADVVYAVSASSTHDRASSWFTSDDDARPGTPFTLDGATSYHRHYNLIPGTVAIHVRSHSLTALHELGHALSSYTNGSVTDLYVDSEPAVNNKHGRPIPPGFGTYNGIAFASDASRNGLGYPAGWRSFHCELIDPALPAIMDDYWSASSGVPEHCQHDRITRQFLKDRLLAKINR